MLFLHLEVKPLMTLTTVLYLSCALISGHLAMMLMELTKRRQASFLVVFNRPINILCRVSLFLRSEERSVGEERTSGPTAEGQPACLLRRCAATPPTWTAGRWRWCSYPRA